MYASVHTEFTKHRFLIIIYNDGYTKMSLELSLTHLLNHQVSDLYKMTP